MREPRRQILAAHLIWTGYGHWLPNDLRGSGSLEVRKDALESLGPVHHGRKKTQPSRMEVRDFLGQAEPLLDHPRLWFDGAARQAIGGALGQEASRHGYSVYALGVCSNHMHAVIRAHRDNALLIWQNLATATLLALREQSLFPVDHPIWSNRPFRVLLHTNEEVERCIVYVNENPIKGGLQRQHWPFVVEQVRIGSRREEQ